MAKCQMPFYFNLVYDQHIIFESVQIIFCFASIKMRLQNLLSESNASRSFLWTYMNDQSAAQYTINFIIIFSPTTYVPFVCIELKL